MLACVAAVECSDIVVHIEGDTYPASFVNGLNSFQHSKGILHKTQFDITSCKLAIRYAAACCHFSACERAFKMSVPDLSKVVAGDFPTSAELI